MSAVHPEVGHDAPAVFALGTWSSTRNTWEKRSSVRTVGCPPSCSFPRSGSPLQVLQSPPPVQTRLFAVVVARWWIEMRSPVANVARRCAELFPATALRNGARLSTGGLKAPAFG